MKQYLEILKNVLNNGIPKEPVRFDNHQSKEMTKVENTTIGLPCEIFQHDMSDGFPLLTTKRIAWKSIRVELEGFIKGITDKRWFQERACKIWDDWCNPQLIPQEIRNDKEAVKKFMKECPSLGPIYGSQWRNFADSDYDQLKTIADRLRKNPYDRRMVCSAWAPHQILEMALPPCHLIWNVIVYGDTISLWWGQRSCDLMLGVPFNIASYALLLELLARHAGLRPYKLVGVLGDCHIYTNQLDGALEQSKRIPSKLPMLSWNTDETDIFQWSFDRTDITDYSPQSAINFGEVTVT